MTRLMAGGLNDQVSFSRLTGRNVSKFCTQMTQTFAVRLLIQVYYGVRLLWELFPSLHKDNVACETDISEKHPATTLWLEL